MIVVNNGLTDKENIELYKRAKKYYAYSDYNIKELEERDAWTQKENDTKAIKAEITEENLKKIGIDKLFQKIQVVHKKYGADVSHSLFMSVVNILLQQQVNELNKMPKEADLFNAEIEIYKKIINAYKKAAEYGFDDSKQYIDGYTEIMKKKLEEKTNK